MNEKNEVTVMPEEKEKAIAVFSEFDKELETRLAESKSVVHDITTKKGNKEARSFVADLRKSKKPVVDAHDKAKAKSLEYGRLLGAEKKRIIGKIDEAIEIHAKPLADLEAAEEKRMEDIKQRIELISSASDVGDADFGIYTSKELNSHLKILKEMVIDDSYGEFEELATLTKDNSLAKLEDLIETVSEQESNAAELAILREKDALREQAERDEQIRENARIQAEQEAADEIQAGKDATKRAEQEKEDALAQAETDKNQAIEDERERVAQANRDEADRKRLENEEAERKAANKNHQRVFNNEALANFEENGIVNGKKIIELIAQGKIKNVTINY